MVGIVIGWRDVKLGDNGQEMQYEKKGEDSELKTHQLTVLGPKLLLAMGCVKLGN